MTSSSGLVFPVSDYIQPDARDLVLREDVLREDSLHRRAEAGGKDMARQEYGGLL